MPWILIPLLALMIPIVALTGALIVRPLIALRERQMEFAASDTGPSADVERLEQRVRVLERIVTDRGLALDAEIEALRYTPTQPAMERA